jgi:hypothetical protein
MANRKQIGWTAVVGSAITLVLGMLIAQVIPAQAAPPTSSVVVTNTPLPVSGDVQVSGDVVVSGTTDAVPVLPNAPFTRTVNLTDNEVETVGSAQAQMGLTSITVTNFDAIPHQLRIFRPVVSGTVCDAAAIIGGSSPSFNLLIPARATLHLPFATAMVFDPLGGVTCLATQVTTVQANAVEVTFNGLGE